MTVIAELWCVGALLGIAVLAAFIGNARGATVALYSAALALSLAGLLFALHHLLFGAAVADITLPLGCLGSARISMWMRSRVFSGGRQSRGRKREPLWIGYGRHEHEPLRVLPFFPAFSPA